MEEDGEDGDAGRELWVEEEKQREACQLRGQETALNNLLLLDRARHRVGWQRRWKIGSRMEEQEGRIRRSREGQGDRVRGSR